MAIMNDDEIREWLEHTSPQKVGRILQPWLREHDGMTIVMATGTRYRLRCWFHDPEGPER